jgi:hypothetical protein
MTSMSMIDALYAGYANALPGSMRELAIDLPFALGLAPRRGFKWTQVFSHAVTLEAPRLILEGLPGARPEQVRTAVLAHALSVIEAFGVDRVEDGQITPSRDLLTLLTELRRGRDQLLAELAPGAVALARAADHETAEAIREEHALLRRIAAATFSEYRRISLGKQAVGFPASLALATASGASPAIVTQIRRVLTGVWLGLQFEDDVGDWEDDWRRGGGAWAVSLARRRLESASNQSSDERPTEPDIVRRRVLKMRVLYLMLREARHQYRTAWRHARALGMPAIARWAEQRQARLDNLLPLEDRHAGYVVRAIKLGSWAAEVLT